MVTAAIRDYLLERLAGREELQHDQEGDCIAIWWTHRIFNPKKVGKIQLKYQFVSYNISLNDGYAVVAIGARKGAGRMIGMFDYADPSFPDNLLASLPPVLSDLPDEARLPQVGATTPDTGDKR